MRINDKTTLSIAAAVSDVLEGKVKKEEAKYPHDMFHPETGEKAVAKTEKDHEELSKKGYTHEKPEVDEAGEPKAKGEKDFKAAHKVKKSGEKEDGSVVKEDTFELVDMDDDTASNAVKLAKKAGLKAEVKKTKTGMDVTVSGDKKKVDKFVKSLPNEDVQHEDEDLEENAAKVDPKAMASDIPQMTLSKFLRKATRAKGLYFDGANLVASKKTKFPDKTTMAGALDPKKKYTVQDLIKAVETMKEEVEEETIEEGKFPKALVKKATDLALKMSGNMTGAVNKIEKMKKGLSDDPEVKAALQMANEEVSEEVVAEAHAMNEAKSKMQEDKERYQKFFKAALKKFGVTSPGELEGDKKKEFFDYVDKNYEADNESD